MPPDMEEDSATPKARRVGVLSGLVAASVGVLVLALLRLFLEVPSPPELIGDRLGARVPVRPFLDLIGIFGSYGRLKAFSVFSVLFGTLVLGAVAGAAYAGMLERHQHRGVAVSARTGVSRRAVVVVGFAVWLAWLLSVAAFWPLLASYDRGAPGRTARAVNSAGLLLGMVVAATTLVLVYRMLVSRPEGQEAAGRPVGRRALLAGGVGLGAAVATGGVLQRLYARSTFGYDGQEYNGAIEPVTPIDRFYVVTQNLVDPEVRRDAWQLEIGGDVMKRRVYDFEAISGLSPVIQESTLACISNPVGGGLMSNAVWKGVQLRRLLEEAGPKPGVVDVVFHGVDGYTDTFPLDKAMDETTIVAYEMNGQPLPRRHGFPARIIVPGLYGEKNVKWVNRIELSTNEEEGFYEQQGWGPSFVVNTQSRFTAPAFDQPLPMAPVVLSGTAFGGDRGVSKVEVSADDGATWQPATITYPGTRLTWSLWSHTWVPTRPGEHRLVVRTVDGGGTPQVSQDRTSGPEGATGYHRVVAMLG